MKSKKDFQFISRSDMAECELRECVSTELGTFFDSVMSTVADYFEEAQVE